MTSTPIRVTENPPDKEHTVEWLSDEFRSLSAGCNLLECDISNPLALVEFMNMSLSKAVLNLFYLIGNPFRA